MKTKTKIIGWLVVLTLLVWIVYSASIKSEPDILADTINLNLKIQKELSIENDDLRADMTASKKKIDELTEQLDKERTMYDTASLLIENNKIEWHLRLETINNSKSRLQDLGFEME